MRSLQESSGSETEEVRESGHVDQAYDEVTPESTYRLPGVVGFDEEMTVALTE